MSLGTQIADSGGRRFFLTAFFGCVYTIMFAASLLTEGAYITLQLMTIGAYLGANGHQKHMEIRHGNGATN